jgi:hypothetical protein
VIFQRLTSSIKTFGDDTKEGDVGSVKISWCTYFFKFGLEEFRYIRTLHPQGNNTRNADGVDIDLNVDYGLRGRLYARGKRGKRGMITSERGGQIRYIQLGALWLIFNTS